MIPGDRMKVSNVVPSCKWGITEIAESNIYGTSR